jgi:hypothetical protein
LASRDIWLTAELVTIFLTAAPLGERKRAGRLRIPQIRDVQFSSIRYFRVSQTSRRIIQQFHVTRFFSSPAGGQPAFGKIPSRLAGHTIRL